MPPTVLFLCVANAARSQLAEALARHRFGDAVRVRSAGSRPSVVSPYALRVLDELGVDTTGLRSKHVDTVDPASVHVVVTLCADEACPLFLGDAPRLDWAMPDPAGDDGDEATRLDRFRAARDAIAARLDELADFLASSEPEPRLRGRKPPGGSR